MPRNIILLLGVNKAYKIYKNPRDRIKEAFHPFGKNYHETFTVLRDIDLKIGDAERVAVVGANGSGKSTLLKIIAGVLRPDTGRVSVSGSVGAILELGAAFHGAYTGTENIYHYGAVMGLKKETIDAKYQEIKAFADLGDFIDRPIKTYSNGMRSRLAFAVSVHTDPDVLMLDEILSVGDISFRRKCFKKMEEFFSSGRTIIYVSHDTGSITELCERSILLDERTIVADGPTREVLTEYQRRMHVNESSALTGMQNEHATSESNGYGVGSPCAIPISRNETSGIITNIEFFDPALVSSSSRTYGLGGVEISNLRLMNHAFELVNILSKKQTYIVRYIVDIIAPQRKIAFGLQIKTEKGLVILASGTHLNREYVDVAEQGETYEVEWRFQCLVQGGLFYINCGVTTHVGDQPIYLRRIEDACVFKVPFLDTRDYSVGLVPMLDSVDIKKIHARG